MKESTRDIKVYTDLIQMNLHPVSSFPH